MDIIDIMLAKKLSGGGGGEGGTTDHRDLSHRNDSNQHSMSAITGLNDALAGKLDASELPNAIETALTQAKSSGEFDGEKGDKGDKGDDGADGHTPIKGVDYFTSTDKSEIVQDVLAALPVWEGGSY